MISCDKCGYGHLTFEEKRRCKSWADKHYPYNHQPHGCCSCGWKCCGDNTEECAVLHAEHKKSADAEWERSIGPHPQPNAQESAELQGPEKESGTAIRQNNGPVES